MIEKIVFEPSQFLANVAELIVSRHEAQRPSLPPSLSLGALQIVIPPRVANDLRIELAKAAARRGCATLVLPRIGILGELAAQQGASVNLSQRVVTTGERVLDIFQELKKKRWFSTGENLALSRELVQLADELTHNLATRPGTLDEHTRNLARAYAITKHNADFSFEATLTYDIWHLLAQPSATSIDAATHYALQLTAWANDPNRLPLYVVGSDHLTRREEAFLSGYGYQSDNEMNAISRVVVIDQSWTSGHLAATSATAKANFIATAWACAPGMPQADDAEKVLENKMYTSSDIAIEYYAAHDVEDEAGAALVALKRWLADGKRNIAVVALDRQAARRLRALAERDQILMSDEIGWPYSTTVSATAIMRWLEARRDGFYFETLIDLVKSPFIFADLNHIWGRERIKTTALVIERAIRRAGVVAGLLRVREAVLRYASADPLQGLIPSAHDAVQLLDRLIAADRNFTQARRSAAEWMDALQESLRALGIEQGLMQDVAGAGLLGHLHTARNEIVTSQIKLSSSEWLDWLRTLIEEARFRDASIESPIVMTSLDATRYRHFDAVLLIGAADANLPGKPVTTGIFNQSVRHTLGLRTIQDDMQHITHDLVGLLNRSDACWISWQRQTASEPQNPSPWVAALMLEAKRHGLSLQTGKPALQFAAAPTNDQKIKFISSRPAPVLEFGRVPASITASGYQSLIDCPYQYFSRGVLKLREPDDVQEEMEKRDFGEFVHDILNRFHHRYPVITGVPQAELRAALVAETYAVFANALMQNFTARAWRLQWESAMDSYLSWQFDREAKGWHWRDGEVKAGFQLDLESGESVRLEGRIDRIDDKHDATESAVIDYKARAFSLLQKKLKEPGEDVQLPVYVALAEAKNPERIITEASYLSIERENIKPAIYPDAESAGQQHVHRLQTLFEALYAGAALPAQGIESVCQYCEARGLCRRDYWIDNKPPGEINE